jgi:hypothetical protein
VTTPTKNAARNKRRPKKARGGAVPVRQANVTEDAGTMLKLLVLDEMGRLIRDAFK